MTDLKNAVLLNLAIYLMLSVNSILANNENGSTTDLERSRYNNFPTGLNEVSKWKRGSRSVQYCYFADDTLSCYKDTLNSSEKKTCNCGDEFEHCELNIKPNRSILLSSCITYVWWRETNRNWKMCLYWQYWSTIQRYLKFFMWSWITPYWHTLW